MYRAKARGRNGYELVAPVDAAPATNRVIVERNLRQALAGGDLRPQPAGLQVDVIRHLRSAGIAVLVLAVGAAATLGASYWSYQSFIAAYPAEAPHESWLPGGLVLFVPYALLGIVAGRVRPSVALVALAVELSLTVLFW